MKTSHLPDENVDEPPEQIFFGLKVVGGGGGGRLPAEGLTVNHLV